MRNPLTTLLFAAAAIALAVATTAAQFGHFPSDTPSSGTRNGWPWLFASTTGRFVQFLDPAKSDLSTGAPLKITDVAFAREGPQSTLFKCSRDFQLRMSHLNTTSTFTTAPSPTFADDLGPCPTNLIHRRTGFIYSTPTANVWHDIGTECDFGWDGKSIIVLEIRFRGHDTALGFSCWADSGIPRGWANAPTADNYDAPTATLTSASFGLKTRVAFVKDHICLVPETTQLGVGSLVSLVGFKPGSAFQIGASLGQTPTPVGNCNICLDADAILWASLNVGPPVFGRYAGISDANGNGTGRFRPPANPALAGLCIYHAAVGMSPVGTSCTNTAGTRLVP